MRGSGLSDRKRQAAQLLAQGMHKNEVARSLGVNRSTVFGWLKDWDFQEHLHSVTAAPKQDEDMQAVRATAVGVARAQVQRAADCEDAQAAREALDACAAALRVARDAAALGGAPAGARPADQEAARLAAESARLAKSLRRRLRKNGAAAEAN